MTIRKIGNFWVDLETGQISINNNMMELFDLKTIGGMKFNVSTERGVTTVKVIPAELVYEIIKAHALLLEHPEMAGTDNLLDLFTGFVDSPFEISWYSSTTDETPPMRAVMQAVKEGNQVVVVERLPLRDPKCLGTRSDK